jgi:hypothetical protein
MKRKQRDKKVEGEVEGTSPNADTEWLPRWAPYAVFAFLTVFLFREFIVSRGLLFGTDVIVLGYFARSLFASIVGNSHVFPLWNPYIFGGLPFVDAMHGDIFYPTTILKFVMPVHRAMGWKIVLHVFLAGVFAFGWLRHLRVSRPIATFGAVTYMLAPVLVSLVYPGHDGKLFVTALTPLALWVTDWAIVRGGAWRFATLSLVIALLIYTAHMQLAYFTTWAIVVLAAFRLAQWWRGGAVPVALGRRLGGLVAAGVVGALLIGALQLWAPVRYLTKYSQRVERTTEAEPESGYTYSTSWSLHPEEAFALVVPEFIGANIQTAEGRVDTYWGRNLFKLNHEYGGLIPLLLLPLAFFSRRRRGEAWLFTGIAMAALVYALGATTPLFRLFYWLVPGVKLFRAPSSIMYLFAIAVISAAALGLEGMREGQTGREAHQATRKVTLYLWVAAGVFLLLALLGSTGAFTDLWTATLYRGIDPAKAAALRENLPNIQRGLWLTVLLSGALAGAWQLRSRRSIPESAWIGALVLLSVVDMLRVDPQYLRVVSPALYFPRDDTTEFLIARQQRSPEPFRVFPLANTPYQPNHFALYGVEELTGHHGNELGRYREMTERDRLGEQNFRVMRLLNVRYLVSGAPLQAQGLREVHRGRRSLVYEISSAFPRAFLVPRLEQVEAAEELELLLSPDFDPARSAIVERAMVGEVAGSMTAEGQEEFIRGRVTWVEREINHQTLQVETSQPAILVVSDNYYPAWHATIDGSEVPLLRADYSLRAVEVPAGTHEVRFVYRSPLLLAALWTTLISLLVVLAIVGTALYTRRRAARSDATAAGGTAPR